MLLQIVYLSIAPIGIETFVSITALFQAASCQSHLLELKPRAKEEAWFALRLSIAPIGIETHYFPCIVLAQELLSIAPIGIETRMVGKAWVSTGLLSIAPIGIETRNKRGIITSFTTVNRTYWN